MSWLRPWMSGPRVAALAALAALLWLAFNLWSVTRYPAPICDEIFYSRSSLAYVNALRSGGAWPDTPSVFFVHRGRLYWLMQGLALTALGRTEMAARLSSILGWAVAILATGWLGCEASQSRKAAAWSAGLVGLSWLGLYVGHVARPDMWMTAASTAALALLLYALRRQQPLITTLAGASLLLPLAFHALPITLMVPAGLAALAWLLIGRRDARGAAALLAGAAFSAALLIWLRVGLNLGPLWELASRHPAGLLSNLVGGGSWLGAGGVGGALLDALAWLLTRFWLSYYAWFIPYASVPQAILFALGLIASFLDSRPPIRLLGGLVIVSSVLYALLTSSFTAPPGYAMLWVPLLTILGVSALLAYSPRRLALWQSEGLLAALALLYLTADLLLVRWPPAFERPAISRLNAALKPGSSVLLPRVWWFALPDTVAFLDEEALYPVNDEAWWNALLDDEAQVQGLLMDRRPISAEAARRLVDQGLADLQPDYVLLDTVMGCRASPNEMSQALAEAVQAQCVPVEEIPSVSPALTPPYFQAQMLYACAWDR